MIIETGVLLLALGIVLVIETIASIVISTGHWPSLAIVTLARLLEIGALTAVLTSRKEGLAALGLNGDKFLPGVKRGLIWSALFGLSALLGFVILNLFGISPMQMIKVSLPRGPGARILFFVAGGFIAPVAEELFFRGIIYSFLRRWGIIFALIGSTALFVLLHSTAGLPVAQAVGGVVFVLAYEVEKNLMVPITIHILGNLSIFLFSLAG
ncbi:MAG: CPBP family intramembrane metalloprotease [Candidatus Tectomicrobia bacterium]|uniref:CPBP family intramembrane metalloprotease n=1 Tax=Tectimicrobiota bacterium TaxID=2528274 RepID=A0A933LR41_UNCTE|nr:CPBP family intramembrane metalloprotease [Candidatus Tectomicrobia bacterium]